MLKFFCPGRVDGVSASTPSRETPSTPPLPRHEVSRRSALLEAMLSRASPVAFGPAAGETRVLLPCVDDVASRAKNLSEAVLDPVSFAIRARQRTRRLHGLSSQYTVPAPTAREVREPANLVEIAVALRDSGLT